MFYKADQIDKAILFYQAFDAVLSFWWWKVDILETIGFHLIKTVNRA